MTTLAIDIGGTKLAAALVDEAGHLSRRATLPTPASRTPDALEAALRDLLTPLCPLAQRFAIASTGIIQDGVLTAINPANLGGLMHFPLVACVERLTGLTGMALNDAQAAAWAEYQPLAARVRDMVFLTISTGVGGGLVRDGRLVIGQGGLAGHVGHTLADPLGPRCGCGRTGCVEAIASGRGIAAAAQDDLAGADAKTIFSLSAEGHVGASMLVMRSATALAHLIADVKATTDCQCVVLGGSIGLAPGYLDRVQTALLREPALYHTELFAAHYQHDAGLLGAAWWANGAKA